MRIIKRGREFEERLIQCKHCESELAYIEPDVKTEYYEWHHEKYILCPVCKNRIVIQRVSEGC